MTLNYCLHLNELATEHVIASLRSNLLIAFIVNKKEFRLLRCARNDGSRFDSKRVKVHFINSWFSTMYNERHYKGGTTEAIS